MKHISIIASLMAICSVSIADNLSYEHEGVVTAQASPQEIEISNQTYHVDLQSNIHGITMGGELGPIMRIGSEVGFNFELREDNHYITDIWTLDNDDD